MIHDEPADLQPHGAISLTFTLTLSSTRDDCQKCQLNAEDEAKNHPHDLLATSLSTSNGHYEPHRSFVTEVIGGTLR